jgi:hypothetical protein
MTTELSRTYNVYCYPGMRWDIPAEKEEFATLDEARDYAESRAASIKMYEIQLVLVTLDTTKKNAKPQTTKIIIDRVSPELRKSLEEVRLKLAEERAAREAAAVVVKARATAPVVPRLWEWAI